MNFLLFAFDKRCPSGGLDDVVAHFEKEPTDQELFDVVASEIRYEALELVPVLCVQLVALADTGLRDAKYFEFRTGKPLAPSAFEFASIAGVASDLGFCALVPIAREVDSTGVACNYCVNDPARTLF